MSSLANPKIENRQLAIRSVAQYLPEASPVSVAQRTFEILISLVVLLLALPIMLVEALIIRLGTPGPALFFQDRVGLGENPFRFVKFRTLYADAPRRWPELYAYKYSDEQMKILKFKIERDPRVTPQGRWLRPTSLDELPNFWNVLKGDMALVGPRPEIPQMLPYYVGDMRLKFSVRPGITGLAQISGRGRLTFYDTVNYDLEYVRNRSLWLDVKIVLKTLRLMLADHGAF